MPDLDRRQVPNGSTAAASSRSFLILSSLVAALGGLLFGFDTAVISGTEGTLKVLYHEEYVGLGKLVGRPATVLPAAGADAAPGVTPPPVAAAPREIDLPFYQRTSFWHGFLVASALIGTIFGSLAFGRPADRHGRRKILFVLGALYVVSAVGCAYAWGMWSLWFFRFIGGLAIGGSSVVAPMYIAEIAPARYRGRLVALTQFNIVFGILLAYLSNYVIAALEIGPTEWRWMFGVAALPAAVFFILLFRTPESPRWLVARKRAGEARAVLVRFGRAPDEIDEELREIEASLDVEHHSLAEPFFCRKYARPIFLAVAIAMFNQLSGINALIYYTKSIFEMAGYEGTSALRQSVIIGFVNLVFTMAAMAVIDRFGRKKLMLVGSIGYIVSLTAAAWAFYSGTGGAVVLASLIVFIAAHAFGQGAVIWVFISEVFPNRVRARGQALGSFTHWIMAALISQTFPVIAEISGWMIFAFYAACMVGQLFWVLLVMPETKGVSLEKIQKEMGIA
jgi:SP family xylose:H+ symportor-like MFS transporter